MRILLCSLLLLLLSTGPLSADSFVIDEPGSSSADSKANDLRRYCGKEDSRRCSEQCRSYFDGAFHRCREDCLADRCVQKRETKKSEADEQDDSRFCIELESETCVKNCAAEDNSARRARCRRECLISRCPSALRSDASKEAMTPGSVACERCKEKVKELCKQSCLGGMAAGGSNYNGLVGFGCNIACTKAQCASSCPVIEFP